ncbi:MAG: hypothetical protein JNL32_00880, partial [Candidatus Kapabacteria bacterium]|nr:hypothetical protein [Candidatus Kapabacteria bacterium]
MILFGNNIRSNNASSRRGVSLFGTAIALSATARTTDVPSLHTQDCPNVPASSRAPLGATSKKNILIVISSIMYLFTTLLEDCMKQQLRSLWRTAYATIVGVTLVATMAFAQTKPVTSPSAQNDGSTSQAELRKKADAIAARQGLEFEQNKGQVIDEKGKVRNDILFTSRSKGTSVYYFADKLSYVFQKELTKRPTAKDVASDEAYQPKYQVHRLDMNLVGANTSAKVASNDLQPGVKNYYLAHAGKDGITGVPSFGKLTYENVYPNIDMVLTAKGQGMKAEFIVRPGGDPSQIKMRFDGADKVALANDGGYSVTTPLGTMTEEKPYSFTSVNGKEQEVAVTFNVNGDVLSFNVPDYDKTQTLVIDPQRDWGTFHGGAGTDIILGVATERSYAPASGARYIYTCGYFGGTGFPLTAGTATASGSADAFVAAYTYGVSGARNYVTVFGGNSEDRANAITVGSSGIAYVVGRTSASLGTPLAANTLQTTYGGGAFDSYIASLSATGTLTAVTFFGTAGTNDNLTSIDLNSAGTEIVVGGNTSSATSQAPWATGLASNAGGEYMNTTQFPTGVQVTGLVATFAVSGTTISSRTRGTYYGATAGTQTIVTSVRYNRTTSGTAGVWVGGYTNSLDSIATPTSHNTGLNVD